MILAVSFLVYIVATALKGWPVLVNSVIDFCWCWFSLSLFLFLLFPFTRVCSACFCKCTSFPQISL